MRIAPLRYVLTVLVVALVSIDTSCSDPMEHARCEDTEIKRVKSPNGKLIAVIYNRSCSSGSGLYTYAEVQDPSTFFLWPRTRYATACFLVTLAGGYHRLDVVWKDDTHIEVSSTDELDKQNNISTQYDHCNDIEVVYHFKFAPPPLDEAPDDETAAAISSAISQMQTCIDSGSNSKRSDELKSLMNNREHAMRWNGFVRI